MFWEVFLFPGVPYTAGAEEVVFEKATCRLRRKDWRTVSVLSHQHSAPLQPQTVPVERPPNHTEPRPSGKAYTGFFTPPTPPRCKCGPCAVEKNVDPVDRASDVTSSRNIHTRWSILHTKQGAPLYVV